MKKIITFGLTLALAISALTMTGCSFLSDLLGGGKSDFDKAVDNMNNFTLVTTSYSNAGDNITYKFTEDKVELTTVIGTKWWDATDTSDYVLLERSYNTGNALEIKHKTKAEYQSGRKDTVSMMFSCLTQKDDQLELITGRDDYDPTYYTNKDGKNIEFQYNTSAGTITMAFFDIAIYVKDGQIVSSNSYPSCYSILTTDANGNSSVMTIEIRNIGTTEISLPSYVR